MAEESHTTNRLTRGQMVYPVAICLLLGSLVSWTWAAGFIEGFEAESQSWQFVRGNSRAKSLRHERTSEILHTGQKSEAFLLETFANDGSAALVHKLPPALRFDELKASVWVWADHPGIQVWVRVRLPKQLDERTGQMFVVDVKGDIHKGGGQWQQLAVDLSDRNFEETMRRVRSNLVLQVGTRNANAEGAYVDQISLRLTDEKVTWGLAIDDLELTPVVSSQQVGTEPVSEPDKVERVVPRIRIGDDRVLLDGLPFFPMVVPYHGESTQSLQKSLCNVVWVPDYEDRDLLQQMSEAGLGVMASPPQPDLENESPERAGLLPFTAQTDPILFWMLDVQIPSSRLQQVSAWADMVRDADRQRARPIWGSSSDGMEREFHRQLEMLGISRSILHTTKTPRFYADSLDQRRRLALPGKPIFTLIPTAPAQELLASRPAHCTVPVVEPEQIWMQANIALAAGFKGIGYLTFDSLEGDGLGAEERRRAIELMNYQIRLVEPWLATAKVLQQARVLVGTGAPGILRSAMVSKWDVRPGHVDYTPEGIAARQIQATVLECDQGLLILLNWLEDTAQYQPGWMVAKDVRILVNRDILQACELTTTGLQEHTVDLTSVAGGTEMCLKEFNQSAVLLVTTDQQAKDALNTQLNQVRPIASEAWAALARAKLTRVRDVHHELVQLAPRENRVPNAENALRDASHLVDQAEKLHAAGRVTEVETPARKAMATLRTLQQSHWKNAVRSENSPASSPHTICFQTLPDHYRMKAALKLSGPASENLLPSGGFDDSDSVLVGWIRTSGLPADSPIMTTAAVVGPLGASYLHLGAGVTLGGKTPVVIVEQTPVTLSSPPIPVQAGQIIRVRGRIRIKQPLDATSDGLLIYDTLVGTVGALRFREPTTKGGWQDFEFTREVAHSGEMRLIFELKGLGNVWLDDLRVTAIPLVEPEADRPDAAR